MRELYFSLFFGIPASFFFPDLIPPGWRFKHSPLPIPITHLHSRRIKCDVEYVSGAGQQPPLRYCLGTFWASGVALAGCYGDHIPVC